jgi:hypothetical protein
MLSEILLKEFKGMNRLSSRFNMPVDYAWDIHNGYIKKDIKTGAAIIKQRAGITKHNTVSFTNACKYIFEAQWSGGGTDLLIREGTRWAKYDGVDSYDDLDTGRASGVRGQAVMFANQVIMADGAKLRKCTSGYVVSDLSTDAAQPTHVSKVHVHQHKVWCNDDDNPMQARYLKTDSANAADSFSASGDAGTLDFSKILPAGDKLLGFATFAEVFLVFIFQRYAVVYSAGTDPSAFTLKQIIPLNCVSGHAVKQVGNDLAVCSLEGVNSFRSSIANQDLDLDDLSKYIAPLYSDLMTDTADTETISVAYSHKLNHLYICIPASEHTILVHSPEVQNIVGRWTGYKCYSILERVDGTMLVGGDGYVYTMNSGTSDDGTAISFQYDFPALYDKSFSYNTAFRQIEGLITHDGSPILNVDYSYTDLNLSDIRTPLTITFTSEGVAWDSDDAVWDSASWAGSTAERFLNSGLLGRGKGLLLSLSNNTLNAELEIEYLLLRLRKEGIKIR